MSQLTSEKKKKGSSFRNIHFPILCVLLILFCEGCSKADPASPQLDAVDDAINRSLSYLVKASKIDGMFKYRINIDPFVMLKDKYNILRHARAIYAMSMHHERHPDENVRLAIEQAGRYLRDGAILSPMPELMSRVPSTKTNVAAGEIKIF